MRQLILLIGTMKRQIWNKQAILQWAQKTHKGDDFASSEVIRHFRMSRATAARLLQELVYDHLLTKTGSTRSARYQVTTKKQSLHQPKKLSIQKKLKNLLEDRVFEEVSLRLQLNKHLLQNVQRIVYYAFCEMLNNAIDHSNSQSAEIEIGIERGSLYFRIRDRGIGIFKNIRQGFKLKSDEEAIEHLLKGKQTTAPENHSGQGIYFTSKIADQFEIRSGSFKLKFSNLEKDISLGNQRKIIGTEVYFQIKTHSRKLLKDLFEAYANDDFEFDRTTYPIIILKQNGAVSRSQARRLTEGLEKFDRLILDFHQIKELGQGFADEIFRVFQSRHPNLVIEVRNANAAVHFMVRRAASGLH